MSENCELLIPQAVRSELLDRIDEMAKRLERRDPTKPKAVIYGDAAERVAAEMKGEAANYKLQILNEVRVRKEFNTNISQFVDAGVKPQTAYLWTLAGRGEAVLAEGSRMISRFVTDLERAGLDQRFYLLSKDNGFTLRVMTELQQLNKKSGAEVGITKDADALAIAKLFKSYVDPLRLRLKEAGLKVADLEGRILKQLWNRERVLMSAPTEQEFVDALAERIDRIGDSHVSELTEQELRGELGKFYQEILGSGLQEPQLNTRDLLMERQTYAVRQGLSRIIHFKTVEDELFVIKAFGGGDVAMLMTDTVRELAEQVHRTYNLGINYRATAFAGILEAERLGADQTQILGGAGTLALSPHNILNRMNGFFDSSAANPSIALWSDTIHNYARAAYLPLAGLNTLTDIPTLNAANRRHGIQAASSIVGAFTRAFNAGKLPPEIAREAGGILESLSVHALGTMHRYSTMPGIDQAIYNGSVWVADKTFKWNGLNRATRALKQVAYMGYSNKLAAQIEDKVAWGDLPSVDRRTLLRAGLVEKDWEQVLASADKAVFKDGNVRFVNTDKLDPALGSKVNAAIARFVGGEAVLTPDLLTQTTLDWGTQRGTVLNVLVRQATFLLGYPVAFMRQAFTEEMRFSGAMSMGMARYVGALTTMGMMLVLAQDLAKGRTRKYDEPEVLFQIFTEGLLKGGGLTIFGEYAWKASGAERGLHHLFFGEDGEYRTPANAPFDISSELLVGAGTEWAARIAGGVGGAAKDFAYYSLIMGDLDAAVDKAGEKLIKTAQRSAPFVGLPGVKPALDAMFFRSLLEMTDSSAMQSAEEKWNARTGGDFFLTSFEP